MRHSQIDPRAVANLILDESQRLDRSLTNLALQKLLYFAHGLYLIETKGPLVSGHFEAWQYGPVHPAVYQAFKSSGDRPITFRAMSKDILTGNQIEIEAPKDPRVRQIVGKIMASYGNLTPGRLVQISHAKNAPWQYVVDRGTESMVFGMRIPDNVIVDRFKHHKVTISDILPAGEPSEDSPFTRD